MRGVLTIAEAAAAMRSLPRSPLAEANAKDHPGMRLIVCGESPAAMRVRVSIRPLRRYSLS
jgi:hypothetical protein